MSEPKIKKTTYCGVRRKKVSNYWFVREATSCVSDPPSNIIVNCSKNTGNGSLTPTSAVGTHEMMERAKLSVMGGDDDNDNVNDNDDNTKPPVKSKVDGDDLIQTTTATMTIMTLPNHLPTNQRPTLMI